MSRTSMRAFCVFLVAVLGIPLAWSQEVRVDTLQALSASTPIPGSQRVPGDFNGDGLSDLLWTNPFTSQIGYWLMGLDGTTGAFTRVGTKTINITPGYFVGAVGDFNGDGLADIVFTSASRDLYLWTNNGQGGFNSTVLDSYPAGWQLVGAGDIDGDGQDDLIWFNAQSCQFGYWLMKSGVRASSHTISVACGYWPMSVGYYTPTQRASIVWTSALHDLYIWDSTPTGFISHNVGNYVTWTNLIGFGGGLAGTGIVAVTLDPVSSPGAWLSTGSNQTLNRVFDDNGQQTSYSWQQTWNAFAQIPWGTAGFMISSRGGVSQSAAIQQIGNDLIEVCAPGTVGVLYGAGCQQFSFPRGWFVVGASANGVMPLVTEGSP